MAIDDGEVRYAIFGSGPPPQASIVPDEEPSTLYLPGNRELERWIRSLTRNELSDRVTQGYNFMNVLGVSHDDLDGIKKYVKGDRLLMNSVGYNPQSDFSSRLRLELLVQLLAFSKPQLVTAVTHGSEDPRTFGDDVPDHPNGVAMLYPSAVSVHNDLRPEQIIDLYEAASKHANTKAKAQESISRWQLKATIASYALAGAMMLAPAVTDYLEPEVRHIETQASLYERNLHASTRSLEPFVPDYEPKVFVDRTINQSATHYAPSFIGMAYAGLLAGLPFFRRKAWNKLADVVMSNLRT